MEKSIQKIIQNSILPTYEQAVKLKLKKISIFINSLSFSDKISLSCSLVFLENENQLQNDFFP